MKLPFFSKKQPNGQTTTTQGGVFAKGMLSISDILAPPAVEVDFNFIKIGNKYYRTVFVSGYPRFVSANWLFPIISFDHTLDISMFCYPVESGDVLSDLKRKIAEMEATVSSDMAAGRVVDASVQVALDDALALQEELAKGAERFFQFGLYITIPAETLEELEEATKRVRGTLASLLIIAKPASLQMEDGFKTTMPIGVDRLLITRNMDTTSLATTFPFTSSELTANEGIMYGINEHNDSLIIFDRFTLENANSVCLGKSGGGKSFLVKLEALRSLMFGTEVIILDPESEYKALADSIGGEYVSFTYSSPIKINPFDLSGVYEEAENELGAKILSLHGLMKVIMGELSPSEESILDRALVSTYRQKGITPDPQTQKKEPPLMEDLYKVLVGMEEAEATALAQRLEKFIKGSLAGIFNQQSNFDLKNTFTVFSLKELEDQLRPIAMHIILDYVWTKIKKDLRRRLLIVDEAWYLMKHKDSANFLLGIAKRARKYYLGLTTITQDVEDFLGSEYGKPIITNSSIQILLKQSPAAIDVIAKTFYLSEGEKHLLLAADIGEGLFFAGPNHVAMRVIASPDEYQLITSKPEEVLQREQAQTTAPPATSPAPNLQPNPAVQQPTT